MTTHDRTILTDERHSRTEEVAAKLAAFRDLDPVPLPIMSAFTSSMDLLRVAGTMRREGGPVDGMCVKLPAGVGKSTAARMLAASVAGRPGGRDDAVLHVELDVEETISVWSSILRRMGDPYWNVGYPKNLKDRAVKFLRKRRVELIIIDEFNHCVDRGQARHLMNTVKELLNGGVAPVVCLGTDGELDQLPRAPGFERRMVHAPAIGPLAWDRGDGTLNWRGFLQGLDRGIVDAGILRSKSALGAPRLAEALCEACGGIVGYAHWVVQDALTETLLAGGEAIERLALATSVDRLLIKFEMHGRINGVAALA